MHAEKGVKSGGKKMKYLYQDKMMLKLMMSTELCQKGEKH